MSKVILTHEVTGLGAPGDVIEVRGGYARNYLVPQGYATPWSRGGEKQVELIKAARRARELATLEEANALKESLESSEVTLTVKSGKEGRLFGSVRPADVAAAVAEAGLGEIDKRKVEIPTAIKSTGSYTATLSLREGVSATISLKVVAAK